MATPILLVGDFPGIQTGLSRILGDVATRLHALRLDGDVDLAICGWAPWADLQMQGVQTPDWEGIRAWAFADLRHWGREAVATAWRRFFGGRHGVLLTIWDAGRIHALSAAAGLDLPVRRWAYVPVDGANAQGRLGGPAAAALATVDRLAAYTAYGQRVLRATVGEARPIAVLPHGYDPQVFRADVADREATRAALGVPPTSRLIGVVATNTTRKDLGLVFTATHQLHNYSHDVHLWLHTDRLVSDAWSVPELTNVYQLRDRVHVSLPATDAELAARYRACDVTIAPGRGEGWGYPIVESQACGTPVLHVAAAGGAELTPADNRLPVLLEVATGPYAILRPIVQPTELSLHLDRVWYGGAACPIGDMTPYQWPVCWPRWQEWIQAGLEEG